MKKIICACLTLLIILSVSFSETTGRALENKNNGLNHTFLAEVKVGFFQLEGFNNTDEQGVRSGYGYDYLMELSLYTGWKYSYVESSFSECLDMLESGEIDMVGSLQENDDRVAKFDFADLSSGVSAAVLFTSSDNNHIAYEDYESFDGITVGVLKGSSRNKQFEQFAIEKGFTYTAKEFVTEDELIDAIDGTDNDADVDAGLLSNLRSVSGYRAVATFSPSPFYFATTKGNADVLTRLNHGMSQIRMHNPGFDTMLLDRYYSSTSSVPAFSKSEAKYIEENPIVNVVFDSDWMPIEYLSKDSGEYAGIMSGIFELIEKRIVLSDGKSIDFQFATADTYAQALGLYSDAKYKILGAVCHEPELAYKLDSSLSSVLFESNILQIINPKVHSNIVALPVGRSSNLQIEKYLDGKVTIKYFDNIEECFTAVRNGDAQSTFSNAICADYYMSLPRYARLMRAGASNLSDKICVAIGHLDNEQLVSIMNKAILSISKHEISGILSTLGKPEVKLEVQDYILSNPLAFWLMVILFLVVIVVGIFATIMTRRRYVSQLRRSSIYDSLTKIFNRDEYYRKVATLIAKSSDTKFMMCTVDVNRFKLVNEFYGTEEGDRLLCHMADRLKTSLKGREDACYGRIDRDIFSWCLPYSLESINRATLIADECFDGYDLPFRITYAIGVYIVEDNKMPVRSMCDRCILALQSAKKTSLNKFAIYDQRIVQSLEEENFVVSNMESALINHEFIIYYQPKVNISTRQLIGAEALVRWNHPQRGIIPPIKFIPFFEKNGFIMKLDFYVWEGVCQLLRKRIDENKPIVPISVNVSRVHLFDPNFCGKIIALVKKYELSPDIIELEITESVYVEDFELLNNSIIILREHGFKILMDDFGSGYSSLNMLKDYTIDVLKIDLKFLVNSKDENIKGRWIIASIIEMAKKLCLDVVAEGVETFEQAEFLESAGCTFGQGYFFDRPMPEDSFLAQLDGSILSK